MIRRWFALILIFGLCVPQLAQAGEARPEQIVIAQGATLTGETGERAQLLWTLLPEGSASKIRFSSSKPRVASVNGQGEIRFKREGRAVIKLKSVRGGAAASIEVLVTNPPKPTGVSFPEGEQLTLTQGDSALLQPVFEPSGAVSSLTWASTNRVIAPIENGAVQAAYPGVATIRCKATRGGAIALVRVTVVARSGESPDPLPLSGYSVGIDPGHQRYGNYQKEHVSPNGSKRKYKMANGTSGVSTKVPEYKQTLRIGFQVRDALEAMGAEVYMTRTTSDVNISNVKRAKMMNELDVDLVLRLHCNAGPRSKRGMTVYASPVGPADTDSKRAASALCAVFKRDLRPKGGASVSINRTFSGLNWSRVPSVLIEMGYMSNPQDDRLMNKPEYQQRLAEAMAQGAVAFLRG